MFNLTLKEFLCVIIIGVLTIFSHNLEASDWTTQNTKWETAYMVTHVID